jgi:hypothetical protein
MPEELFRLICIPLTMWSAGVEPVTYEALPAWSASGAA